MGKRSYYYNMGTLNALYDALESIINELKNVGDENKGLVELKNLLHSWNNGTGSNAIAIWQGSSGLLLAYKIKTYTENVKKLRALTEEYQEAVRIMKRFEEAYEEKEALKEEENELSNLINQIKNKLEMQYGSAQVEGYLNNLRDLDTGLLDNGDKELFEQLKKYKVRHDEVVDKIVHYDDDGFLSRKQRDIADILNQRTIVGNDEQFNSTKSFNNYIFCKVDMYSEIKGIENEKNHFENINFDRLNDISGKVEYFSVGSSDASEQINTIISTLLKKRKRILGYIGDLCSKLNDVIKNLDKFSLYMAGKYGSDGSYGLKVPSLYRTKFKVAKNHFGDIVGQETHACIPTDDEDEINETTPEKFTVDLKPGDEGLLDLTYIDYARLARTAASALNGQATDTVDNVNSWIPEEFISKQWWGYHTNGVIRYKVRDDGTVLFYDWNERDKEWKSMAFTSKEVLTKSLEEQGWMGEPRWDTPLADIKKEREDEAKKKANDFIANIGAGMTNLQKDDTKSVTSVASTVGAGADKIVRSVNPATGVGAGADRIVRSVDPAAGVGAGADRIVRSVNPAAGVGAGVSNVVDDNTKKLAESAGIEEGKITDIIKEAEKLGMSFEKYVEEMKKQQDSTTADNKLWEEIMKRNDRFKDLA